MSQIQSKSLLLNIKPQSEVFYNMQYRLFCWSYTLTFYKNLLFLYLTQKNANFFLHNLTESNLL